MWTESTSPEEYVQFLERLLRDVTSGDPPGFREGGAIAFGGYDNPERELEDEPEIVTTLPSG